MVRSERRGVSFGTVFVLVLIMAVSAMFTQATAEPDHCSAMECEQAQ